MSQKDTISKVAFDDNKKILISLITVFKILMGNYQDFLILFVGKFIYIYCVKITLKLFYLDLFGGY